MSTAPVVPFLASRVTSTTAQLAASLMQDEEIDRALAANKNLNRPTWDLLRADASAKVAIALIRKDMDQEQIQTYLDDKRSTVREAFFARGTAGISQELAYSFLDKPWFSSTLASIWLRSGRIPRSLVARVALKARGPQLIHYLQDSELFTPSQVIDAILSAHSLYQSTTDLWKLVDLRPEIIPALLSGEFTDRDARMNVAEALSGCRHVFDHSVFEQLYKIGQSSELLTYIGAAIATNLLSNPNVSLKLKSKVAKDIRKYAKTKGKDFCLTRRINGSTPQTMTNQAILDQFKLEEGSESIPDPVTVPWEQTSGEQAAWVISHARLMLPGRYPSLSSMLLDPPQQPAQDPASTPVILPSKFAAKPLDQMVLSKSREYSRMTTEQIALQIQPAIDPLGVQGWKTFLALAPQWHSTVAELMATTVVLTGTAS